MANGGRRARGAPAAPSSSPTFEVEAITNVRFAGRQNVEYLVQWKVPPGANPDDYEPTWEAEDNLEGCEDALRDFCVEWTRQYEAALKVCPRPPAQFAQNRPLGNAHCLHAAGCQGKEGAAADAQPAVLSRRPLP